MPSTGNSGELRSRELHVGSSSTGQAREGCKGTRHDTATAYQVDGCRCPDAVTAQSLYRRRLRWRHRRGDEPTIDATGTRRRIHALMAIGWARADILASLGYADTRNQWLTRAERVNRRTAERVAALYDELADTPRGPSRQTAAWARRHGYLPPLWWDDDTIDDPTARSGAHVVETTSPAVDPVVVERIIDGQPPLHVTRAERAEAVRTLHTRGRTNSQIGKQLSVSGARVRQILAATVRVPADTPATNDCQESA